MGAAGRPVLLAAAVLAVAVALDRAGLPAPALFAGLTVGLAHALLSGRALRLPESGVTAAHGVIGVTVGVTVQPTTLSAVAGHWLPVTLVTIATLALSIGAGPLLARWTPIDAPTAALGLIAGGASGITAMSDDLGADSRIVAVLQYLRILLIVLLMPAVVVLLFGGEGASSTSTGSLSTDVRALPAVAVLAAAGAWTGRRLRLVGDQGDRLDFGQVGDRLEVCSELIGIQGDGDEQAHGKSLPRSAGWRKRPRLKDFYPWPDRNRSANR